MAIPAGVQKVVVTFGPWYGPSGEPLAKEFIYADCPAAPIQHENGSTVVKKRTKFATDASGQAVREFVATDADGLAVANFTYTFTLPVEVASAPINVSFPKSAPTVNFGLLVPQESSEGVIIWQPSEIPPSGGAGGVLEGNYPNPGLNAPAVDSFIAGRIADDDSSESATRTALKLAVAEDLQNRAGPVGVALDAALPILVADDDGSPSAFRVALDQVFGEEIGESGSPASVALSAAYVHFGSTPPDHAIAPVWLDTSTLPPVFKYWDGTTWTAFATGGGTVIDLAFLTESGDYLTLETGDLLLTA